MTVIHSLTPEYAKRLGRRQASNVPEIWDLLDGVCDPELPGVSLWALGVLQDIRYRDDCIEIDITLTYSGCPAVITMKDDIIACLQQSYPDKAIKVEVVLSPAWCTDAMSPEANQQLAELNIAAPDADDQVICPICSSHNTEVVSQFGSTSCKALYRCLNCAEPFDYFKTF